MISTLIVARFNGQLLFPDHVEMVMRKLFNIPDDKETRLWNGYTQCTFEPLHKKDLTIHDAALYQGQVGSYC